MPATQRIRADSIHAAIQTLGATIITRHPAREKLLLLGIANGGIVLAQRLASQLSKNTPALTARVGTLDISFHRDDIGRNPIPKEFAPTHIPVDVNGAHVILVDDVLFSGRTVKAALDELFDHGRPAKVELAILVDRGGRKMPIAPDFCGLLLNATDDEKVVVKLDPDHPENDLITVEKPAKTKD